ncbi:MAG: hypothetical protein V1859_00835 [archaeon]
MKEKLKKLFMLGVGVTIGGLDAANKKKAKAIVDEFVENGELTIKEGELLFKELVAESGKIETRVKAKLVKIREQAKAELKKKKR